MPVRPGEKIDPERTRQRILRAAATALNEEGAAAMSVNAIAKQASASKATIYRAFGNRQGLIDAVLSDRSRNTVDRLADLEASYPEPIERLNALVDWHGAWFDSEDFRGSPIVRAVIETLEEPLLKAGKSHLDSYEQFVGTIVEQLGQTPAVTMQIIGLLEGATIVAAINGPDSGRATLLAVSKIAAAR